MEKYFQISRFIVLSVVLLLQSGGFENTKSLLYAMGFLVFFFGVPHGAADTLIYIQVRKRKDWAGWLAFLSIYMLMAYAIYSLWVFSPIFFLGYLLLISVIHFGEDLLGLAGLWTRLGYGVAIIALPSLLWQDEVAKIFGFLIEESFAIQLAQLLNFFSIIISLSLYGMFLGLFGKKSENLSKKILWPILALILLEPIIGFSLYFSLWHSHLHLARLYSMKTLRCEPTDFAMVLGPLLVTFLFSFFAFQSLGDFSESSLSKVMFVGLGSLTFPHFFMVYALGRSDKSYR